MVLLAPRSEILQRAGTCETPTAPFPSDARFPPLSTITSISWLPNSSASAGAALYDTELEAAAYPGERHRRGRKPAIALPGPSLSIFIEFQPIRGAQTHAAAVRTLLISLATLVALAAAGFALWRLSVRAEHLQAASERARRLAALGEMSAVVAHELRNPLASLKGHAQLLAEALPADGREHGKAERIVREAVRLERLCEDLLGLVGSDRIDPQRSMR